MISALTICLIAATLAADAPIDTASSVEIFATRLDGGTVRGQLATWSTDGLVLTVDGEPVTVTQAELLSIKIPGTADVAANGLIVELADGSTIPAVEYTAKGKRAALTLPAHLTQEDGEVRIAIQRVAAVQIQPLTDAAADDWAELREMDLPADLLVIQKGAAGRLDYLEGAVGDMTETHVNFLLDGDSIPVKRAKIVGVIYYRPQADARNDAPCIVHGEGGLQLRADRATLDRGRFEITSATGLNLSISPATVAWVDFSAGKLTYLSDLTPLASDWTPLLGLPASATVARRAGQPRFDQSFYGGPLSLVFPAEDANSSRQRIETYTRGLALRSRSELTFRVPEKFRRFTAVAGIEPEVRQQGDVRLVIEGDGQVLFDEPIAGTGSPVPIDLPVTGIRRLRVLVDYGENWDTGDLLHLCDAKFTK